MHQQTLCLPLLLALIGICSADDIPVISGVFMPNNITVDYEGAKTACAMNNSRLATLDEITTAYKKGYEYCKWGWIVEHKLVMLRLTPSLPCAGHDLGILIRDCPTVLSAFCADGAGAVSVVILRNKTSSYENASLACLSVGSIATKKQVEDNIGRIPNNTLAWFNWGVGQVQNNELVSDECYNSSSQASAFCYNPSLADVITENDTQIWKKIAIGVMLGMIFVILLVAAAFMRGNKFICCMGNSKTQSPDVPQSSMPTWNNTGTYRHVSQANKGVLYDNMTDLEKRPAAIHPAMNIYKTHYTNMAFDLTGEE